VHLGHPAYMLQHRRRCPRSQDHDCIQALPIGFPLARHRHSTQAASRRLTCDNISRCCRDDGRVYCVTPGHRPICLITTGGGVGQVVATWTSCLAVARARHSVATRRNRPPQTHVSAIQSSTTAEGGGQFAGPMQVRRVTPSAFAQGTSSSTNPVAMNWYFISERRAASTSCRDGSWTMIRRGHYSQGPVRDHSVEALVAIARAAVNHAERAVVWQCRCSKQFSRKPTPVEHLVSLYNHLTPCGPSS
jgi:hypothetical protein